MYSTTNRLYVTPQFRETVSDTDLSKNKYDAINSV